MYANNRLGTRPAARFQRAGGTIFLYSHPFLSGQIIKNIAANEVDVTPSLRLADTFFNAAPTQDNAVQEVAVDGTVITITNNLMNGRATLQVLPGSGLVGHGDLISIAHFINSTGDDTGGVLKRIKFVQGRTLTRVYYGVAFANVPHEIIAGNSVPPHPVQMLYSGWYEGVDAGRSAEKILWAVGNKYGFKGNFVPFTINSVRVDDIDDTGEIDASVDNTALDEPVNNTKVVPSPIGDMNGLVPGTGVRYPAA